MDLIVDIHWYGIGTDEERHGPFLYPGMHIPVNDLEDASIRDLAHPHLLELYDWDGVVIDHVVVKGIELSTFIPATEE